VGAQRVSVLEAAANLITGDRSNSYGDYGEQMQSIAMAFNAMHYGSQPEAPFLNAQHISLILMLLKLRRRVTAKDLDSIVDLCGYAALDAEFFTPPETKG
jgi:hypothetical protein